MAQWIAPEGVAAEREDFRAVVLKGRLAEAERHLKPETAEICGGRGGACGDDTEHHASIR